MLFRLSFTWLAVMAGLVAGIVNPQLRHQFGHYVEHGQRVVSVEPDPAVALHQGDACAVAV
jgi:hypothetical protein